MVVMDVQKKYLIMFWTEQGCISKKNTEGWSSGDTKFRFLILNFHDIFFKALLVRVSSNDIE